MWEERVNRVSLLHQGTCLCVETLINRLNGAMCKQCDEVKEREREMQTG